MAGGGRTGLGCGRRAPVTVPPPASPRHRPGIDPRPRRSSPSCPMTPTIGPADAEVHRIGEEVAAARALSDLAHKLLEQAVRAIEAREGHQRPRPVTAW